MLKVDHIDFAKAVLTAQEACGKEGIGACLRLLHVGDALRVISSHGAVTVDRTVKVSDYEDTLDTCVNGAQLAGVVKAFRTGKVTISWNAGHDMLTMKQGKSTRATFETLDVSHFPSIPAFDEMTPIYDGYNPTAGFKAVKDVALKKAGTTAMGNVLIMMNGAAYLSTGGGAVRCDFSLIDRNIPPIPVSLDSVWALPYLSDHIRCLHDERRVLVVDDSGFVVIQKWSGDLGQFPETVRSTFASLVEVGQIRLSRKVFLQTASAAKSVLKDATKGPLWASLETSTKGKTLDLVAGVGRRSYKETLPAIASGDYRIWVDLGRLVPFLRSSPDEVVLLKIMDGQVPHPFCVVHLVDTRLHEAIPVPLDKAITSL